MTTKAETLARIEAVFNAASDHFDHPALPFWDRFGQQTVTYAGICPGDRVLDVCCGTGASAIPAAIATGTTGQVLAVDIAESLLALGRQKATEQGLHHLEFRYGDFENLGLPDGDFDVIICVFGIFFVADMAAALQELWRLLRPGGRLAITSWGAQVFEPANSIFWDVVAAERPDLSRRTPPWERISDAPALQQLLQAAGITPVQVMAAKDPLPLACPEDWWTMVLGGGLRGTVEQLDPATRERVRQRILDQLRQDQVDSLAVDVLYAIAHKPAPAEHTRSGG